MDSSVEEILLKGAAGGVSCDGFSVRCFFFLFSGGFLFFFFFFGVCFSVFLYLILNVLFLKLVLLGGVGVF